MDTHRLKNRIAELEASESQLREALEMFCGNIGTQEASSFNKARFPVTWVEGNAALTATGQQEHPDTERLRTAIVGLQAIEAETMNVSPSVHARACLAAIDALKEAERG